MTPLATLAAQASLPRAEHDQPCGAQPGELDDTSRRVPGELFAGRRHAGFLRDRERIGECPAPRRHLRVEAALVVRLSECGRRASANVDEHERGSKILSLG